jgi:hypothetical protein
VNLDSLADSDKSKVLEVQIMIAKTCGESVHVLHIENSVRRNMSLMAAGHLRQF